MMDCAVLLWEAKGVSGARCKRAHRVSSGKQCNSTRLAGDLSQGVARVEEKIINILFENLNFCVSLHRRSTKVRLSDP